MNKKTLNENLQWVLDGNKYETIYELKIPTDVQTMLLYNTNDLYLNPSQFKALMSSIDPSEKIYVAQNDSDDIYEFESSVLYDEYQALNIYSMTYLTSSSFDWVVILDENLESGIGILAAKNKLIEDYPLSYQETLNDIQMMIEFHYRDAVRNPHSIDNLVKILSLWHGKDMIRICDECGSEYLASTSKMASLCPECAHVLYGYENCKHIFKDGKCTLCLWDGSRSDYIKSLKQDEGQ